MPAFKGRFFLSSTVRKSILALNCREGDSVLQRKKTIEKVKVLLRRNVLIVKAVKAGVVTISRKP